MPYSIKRENAARDLDAVRRAIHQSPLTVEQYNVLTELADSIEEQVKPEEPLGDVLVRFDLVYRRQANGQWWPVDRVGSGYEWSDLVAESKRQDIDLTIYRVDVADGCKP